MLKRTVVIGAATAMLMGCAVRQVVPPAPKTPEDWARGVRSERDDYRKVTTYRGQQLERDGSVVFLRAHQLDAAPKPAIQIYVAAYYGGGWRFYDSAFDREGKVLPVTVINREVSGCSRYGCGHIEHIGLAVDDAYLASRQGSGIDFQLSGKGGKDQFYLPGGYIEAFLASLPARPAAATR